MSQWPSNADIDEMRRAAEQVARERAEQDNQSRNVDLHGGNGGQISGWSGK